MSIKIIRDFYSRTCDRFSRSAQPPVSTNPWESVQITKSTLAYRPWNRMDTIHMVKLPFFIEPTSRILLISDRRLVSTSIAGIIASQTVELT